MSVNPLLQIFVYQVCWRVMAARNIWIPDVSFTHCRLPVTKLHERIVSFFGCHLCWKQQGKRCDFSKHICSTMCKSISISVAGIHHVFFLANKIGEQQLNKFL